MSAMASTRRAVVESFPSSSSSDESLPLANDARGRRKAGRVGGGGRRRWVDATIENAGRMRVDAAAAVVRGRLREREDIIA